MKIVISGASGMIGSALSKELKNQGHETKHLVRRPTKTAHEIQWDPLNYKISSGVLDGADAVVNLNGANIGGKRWTESYKQTLVNSRLSPTATLATAISQSSNPPKCFLSGSAIGYYGARGSEELTEQSNAGQGFLAQLTKDWEAAAAPVAEAGVRTCYLRTGVVLHPSGGALQKMLPLFKFGLGGKMGNGNQIWSWITLADEVNAIIHLITSAVSGPVNLTSPTPVTNEEFTKQMGAHLGRPTVLPVPKFGPSLLLGSELAQSLLFDSANVLPRVLAQSGFTHAQQTLSEALESLIPKRS